MTSNKSIRVSIIIPTYRRPEGLKRALISVLEQQGIDWSECEIIVVDNDPAQSAKETVTKLSATPVEVMYVSEPNPGVANARNAALVAAQSKLIAFLDDDQTASPVWLEKLLELHDNFRPAVIFGKIDTALPTSVSRHHNYLKRFFARTGPDTSGPIDEYYGCGNSLLDLNQVKAERPLFDARSNETGGEDDILFAEIEAAGGTFAWSKEALAYEHVPQSRARLKYTMRRAFSYGQGPSIKNARKSPPDIPAVIFWMSVGAAQFGVFAIISAVMFIIRAKDRAFWYDRAAQGIGKIFWGGVFDQKFYGVHSST